MRTDLREKIADAIASADIGFSMNLIRLVDGIHTYSLKYTDGEYLEFCDDEDDEFDAQERLYAHVRQRKRQRQADAVLTTLKAQGITKPDDGRELVKLLEWTKHPTAEAWRCDTMLGTYQVWVGSLATSWQFDSLLGERINEKVNDAQDGKAAAQSDFERRILSALASPSRTSLTGDER